MIVEAQPDLILGVDDYITEDIYPQLSQIAPTVVISVDPGDWRSRMILAGGALNIADQVEALLGVYDARVAELQELIGDELSDIEVSLVRAFPNQTGIMLTGSIADQVIQEVGLARPEAQIRDLDFVLNELGGRAELSISREDLRLADGDVIFIFGIPDELLQDPLWQQLSAVQTGKVYTVGYYWYVEGLISVHDMLDDLFNYLAGTESTVPNPFENSILPSAKPTLEATAALTQGAQADTAQASPNPFPTSEAEATPEVTAGIVQVPGFPPFAPAPTMLEVIEDRGDTLVVRHLFGETEIPANPERIYADSSTFDILLSLGIEPVAANTLYIDELEPPSQLAPLIEDLTLYNRGPANPENILIHQPDLILVWEVALWEGSEGIYDLLSAIAPTVVLNANPFSYWEQATVDIAKLLGRSTEAADLLEGYRAFVENSVH